MHFAMIVTRFSRWTIRGYDECFADKRGITYAYSDFYFIRSDVFIYIGTCYSDFGYSEVRVYSSSRGSKQKEIERE